MDTVFKSNKWINFIKCISTYLVVMVHSANILTYAEVEDGTLIERVLVPFRACSSFGVPFFFIISGYLLFLKDFDWKQNIVKKSKSLLIPFFFWNLAWMLFEFVAGSYLSGLFEDFSRWTISDFLLNLSFRPFYAPFWFIWWLFLMNLLAGVIKWLLNRSQVILAVLIIAIWYMPFSMEYVTRARQSIVFFVIGGMIAFNKDLLGSLIEKHKKELCFACSFVVLLALLGNGFVGPIVEKTIMIIGVLAMFMLLVCLSESLDNCFCDKWVKHTFLIYALHGKILSVLQIMAVRLFEQNEMMIVLEYFVLPILVVIICVILSILYKKVLPNLYKFSIGGR